MPEALSERDLDRHRFYGVLAVGVLLGAALALFSGYPGFDLAPMWIAGVLWADGNATAIYGATDHAFDTLGSDAFAKVANDIGYDGTVHAFVYPPLWAALIAPLTKVLTFSTFNAVVLSLHAVALVLTFWWVWKASKAVPFAQHAALAALLVCLTLVFTMGFKANQVHLTVSMLLALSCYRLTRHDQIGAGVALALAAALKLYPALLVFVFLAQKKYRAAASFAVTGLLLGATSLALGGVALHVDLLEQLSLISHSLILNNALWNFDSLLLFVVGPETFGLSMQDVATSKPTAWGWATRLAPLLFLAYLFWRIRSRDHVARHPLLWPYAILGLAFLGPISWCFTYILPLIAAPLLVLTWPRHLALLLLFGLAASISMPSILISERFITSMPPMQVVSSFSMFLLMIAFDRAIMRRRESDLLDGSTDMKPPKSTEAPLHPVSQSL
ncbi:MAG: glycosyltransferase 87 family protein [Pseudomonadota bacterium]